MTVTELALSMSKQIPPVTVLEMRLRLLLSGGSRQINEWFDLNFTWIGAPAGSSSLNKEF